MGHVDGTEPAIALVRSVNWKGVMTAWSETQEGPLPAVVSGAGRKAEFYMSHVPTDEAPYDAVHIMQTKKTGWCRSQKTVDTAEVHSHLLLSQCLADWEAGR